MTRKIKDSGVEWIGEIPEDWSRTFIINILREPICDGPHETPKLVDCGVPFVSVDSLNESENINLDIVRKYISEEDYMIYSKKTKIEKEDILFSKSATIGKTAIVKNEKFMVWSPIAVLKCNRSIMNNKYLYYILSSDKLIEYVRLLGGYNTQINVGMRTLEKAYIPLPSKAEQQVIANYLDNKCNKIEKTIEKEKVIVKKLQEYKQSVITEAVTKGLNTDVKMKDSGVEWIGDIPEHWNITPLKYTVEYNKYNLSEKTEDDLNISYIDIGSVTNEEGIKEIQYFDFKNAPSRARRIVKTGDTIISTVRTYLKAIAYISDEYNNFICSTGFAVCTPKDCYIDKYMFYCLHAEWFVSIVESISVGISYPAINTTNLMNLKNIVPPIQEQREIVDYLNQKCLAIDKLITNKEKVIEKLTEYKKSLIYECVTGKREVQ